MSDMVVTDSVVIDGDGATQLFVAVPDGWRVGEVGGADAVLWNPAVCSTFRTNVMLSCDAIARHHQLSSVAVHTLRHLHECYGALEVRGEVDLLLGDAPCVVRMVLFDSVTTRERLAQFQAFADGGLDESGTQRLIFQIVATCLAEDIAACGDDLAHIIATAQVRRSPTSVHQ